VSTVLIERDGPVTTITINRPDRRNALDMPTFGRLAKAWYEFRDDPDAWVAIVTGAGDDAFCVGADLRSFVPAVTDNIDTLATGQAVEDFPANAALVAVLREWELHKPVIAAVNGTCVAGGMEMLLGTDIRIASENARFGIFEPKRGLFPGGGTTVRLPRQVPYAVAMEILLCGEYMSAQRAYEIGLVNAVVPREELLKTARAYAEKIIDQAPLAIRAIKRSVHECARMPMDEAFRHELMIAAEVFSTEDAIEGPRAFMEKRRPDWKGK
jgi:enoyl-CoA hydratase